MPKIKQLTEPRFKVGSRVFDLRRNAAGTVLSVWLSRDEDEKPYAWAYNVYFPDDYLCDYTVIFDHTEALVSYFSVAAKHAKKTKKPKFNDLAVNLRSRGLEPPKTAKNAKSDY